MEPAPPVESAESFESVLDNTPPPQVPADYLTLPLHVILKDTPQPLRGKALPAASAGKFFTLSKTDVVKQLAHGAVKVSVSDLKKIAPGGLFVETPEHDAELISLPLQAILSQLSPQDYSRRPNQQRVEIPNTIADLFGPRGHGLADVKILKKDPAATTGGGTTAFQRKTGAVSVPVVPVAPFVPTPPVPAAGSESAHDSEAYSQPATITASESLKQAMLMASVAPKTAAPATPKAKPAPGPATATASAPIAASTDASVISVPLAELVGDWPEAIQGELVRLGISVGRCDFPVELLTSDMRKGRVAYAWSQIRGWIYPAPEETEASSLDATELEVPLRVVTPHFMRRVTMQAKGPAGALAGDLPDMFASAAAPAPARAPAAKADAKPKAAPAPAAVPEAAPVAAAPAAAAESGAGLRVPIATLASHWPEAIQQEIGALQLGESHLVIPEALLQSGLRSGKLAHPWSKVAGWIEGYPDGVDGSPHAGTTVELPLPVVAPLFFQARKGGAVSRQAYVPKDIPDLFSADGVPNAAAAVPAPAAAPVAAPAPAAMPAPAAVETPKKPKASNIAELFGEPKKKNWTPNEIIQRTGGLPGVAGAMIVLQDGLLVAGSLPPGWKPDTVAAFIPQMFGRMRQYTRELNIGELSSLTFLVDKGPMQIFNAGLIYFVVLGKNDGGMPVDDLSLIARELSRHTK